MAASEVHFQNLSTSCRKLEHLNADLAFTYILLALMSLLTPALNLLVIISISHFKQLHTPTNLLLLSLAFSDFFVSFFLIYQVMHLDGCWIFSDLMCILHYVLGYLVTSTSVGNIVLISIDRYVAICDPLHYPTKVTYKKVQICVLLCWICSLFWNIIMLRDSLKHPGRYSSRSGDCLVVLGLSEQLADLIVSLILPITFIVVLYTRVFAVVVSQVRAMRSNIAAITQKQAKTVRASASELKAARSLGVVVAVFIICLFPHYLVTITGQNLLLKASTMALLECVFFLNSCINPLIYAFFYPWFRKSIRLILTLEILQPDSCDSNIL